MNGLLEKTVKEAATVFRGFLASEKTVGLDGFMQRLDARVKVAGLVAFVVYCAVSRSLPLLLALFLLSLTLSSLSRIGLRIHLSRFLFIPIFSFIVVLPSAFITPGQILFNIQGVHATVEGLSYVCGFTIRVAAAASYLSLLILTTKFSHIIAVLRWFRLPSYFIEILAITYRYIVLLFTELYRMLLAKESRTLTDRGLRNLWRSGGRTLGRFLVRAVEKGERVQMAARAKGYNGEAKVYPPKYHLGRYDCIFIVILVASVTVPWWMH